MALKQRVLADWNIPPTDLRLGKMNPARWILAGEMQAEKERRLVRMLARLLGTDMAMIGKDEMPKEKFGDAPQVFPLAGLINPEAYGKFMDSEESSEPSFVPDEEYERQVQELEKAGALTDIDVLSEQAEGLAKQKR